MKLKLTLYHIMLAIVLLYVFSLVIFPLAYSIVMSFTDWKLGEPAHFVGIRNYYSEFIDYRFYNSLKVTLLITGVALPIEMALGLVLAALLNLKIRFKSAFKIIFLIPLFCSPVAVSMLGQVILYEAGGPVNGYLKLLGLPQPHWRTDRNLAPFSVALCDIWEWTPFCFLIFFAAIQAIPRVYYEAAEIDGASGFQIFRHIMLPMLTYAFITVSMFRLVDTLRLFEIPFLLFGGGGPGIATETQTIYIYKKGFRSFLMGEASANSIVFLVIVMVIMMIFIKKVRKYYA
ncbi:sugar ABC transporter permease [Candidatus Bathyarchaeota archaeon]|nr:MAG: sugar ABC transporter permease [Candidatus Bathyarchaeota archaeon]